MQRVIWFSVVSPVAFLLVMVIALTCCAQSNPPVNGTSTAVQKLRDSIDANNKSVQHLIDLRQYTEARELAILTVKRARGINYINGEGNAHLNLSSIYYAKRRFSESELEGKQALALFSNGSGRAWALIRWGQAIWARSDFHGAVTAFGKAQGIFTAMRDSSGIGASSSLLALAEEERGNYDKSFQYAIEALNFHAEEANVALGQLYADVGDYETALDFYGRIKDSSLKIQNYLKVGEVYSLKDDFEHAKYYYQSYLSTLNKTDKYDFSKPYTLLGEMYVSMGKYDTALYYLNTALTGFKQVNDNNWVMRTLLELGKTYNTLHRPKQASVYLKELLSSASQSGARQYVLEANYLLYQIEESRGNYKSAYAHLKEYTSLNKVIGITQSARKLAFFKASAQLAQAKLKIDLLNRDKQLQVEELKSVSQQRMFMLIGVLGLCLIFGVLIRNAYLKRKNADHLRQLTQNELQIEKLENTKKLAELEMQMLRTQMNPHFIFNSLNSINRFILQNNKTDAAEYLTKFSRLVRMILQNSQNTIITLEDELNALRLYLELEMLRFDNRFSYNLTIENDVDISMIKVPPLIIQPFVENAIWHGLMPKETPGLVEIVITEADNMLITKVSDDGVGRAQAVPEENNHVKNHRSYGIDLTTQRIKIMYNETPSKAPVTINDLTDTEGNPAGTEVILILPICYD
ncbi:histidine kinase [Mucilaginibacter sabulilitoris]|uniref:Histidine kinase n=2 Tax=Mucilaginibacter sabulilitoris TaxID=1173583 RepID=A0ABZ0TGC0_9SPHI|nr:histidine kinase [Mucilaginibacter sabulilitoris]WPU92231.1 histidine kinase [Mucilaginibacter sabulilitoris]